MSELGWIKLHRKIRNNPIYERGDYFRVWIELLLLANHEETTFIWNNEKQTLKKGQLLTGRKKLSKKLKISQSSVYKILKYLEKEQQIEQQKTTKFTVITILNWGIYQEKEQQKEQQSNNRVTTEEQQSNTYKNDKKNKEEKEIISLINLLNKTSIKSIPQRRYADIRKTHTFPEIIKAILVIRFNKELQWYKKPLQLAFQNGTFTLNLLFAEKDKDGNEIDRIEEYSNIKLRKDDELELIKWCRANADFIKNFPQLYFLRKLYE